MRGSVLQAVVVLALASAAYGGERLVYRTAELRKGKAILGLIVVDLEQGGAAQVREFTVHPDGVASVTTHTGTLKATHRGGFLPAESRWVNGPRLKLELRADRCVLETFHAATGKTIRKVSGKRTKEHMVVVLRDEEIRRSVARKKLTPLRAVRQLERNLQRLRKALMAGKGPVAQVFREQALAAKPTVKVKPVSAKLHAARVARVNADLESLSRACRLFEINMGHSPRALEHLWKSPPNAGRWKGPYVEDPNPRDPWGNPYRLELSGPRPQIVCLGADGKPGGTGQAADLTSRR